MALSGFGMLVESGYPAIRDGGESYDIEQKYGYSTEEIFSSSFFSTRKPQFYDFYRKEILSALDTPPGKGFYEMARLEEMRILQTIITRRIFHLPHVQDVKMSLSFMEMYTAIIVHIAARSILWSM